MFGQPQPGVRGGGLTGQRPKRLSARPRARCGRWAYTLGLPNKPRQSVNEAPAKTSQYPAGAALELSIDMCVLVA